MYIIHYVENGKIYSDFELDKMLQNPDLILAELKKDKPFHVATGSFIKLVSLLIAMKKVSHDEVVLVQFGKTHLFNEMGQVKEEMPENHFASLPWRITRKFMDSIYEGERAKNE